MDPTTRRRVGPSGLTLSVDEAGRIIDQLHFVALELMPYADDRATVAGSLLHAALRDLADVVDALELAVTATANEADVEGFAALWIQAEIDLRPPPASALPQGDGHAGDPIVPPTDHLPHTRAGAVVDAERRLAEVWTSLARAHRPEADAVAAAGRLVLDSTNVGPAPGAGRDAAADQGVSPGRRQR